MKLAASLLVLLLCAAMVIFFVGSFESTHFFQLIPEGGSSVDELQEHLEKIDWAADVRSWELSLGMEVERSLIESLDAMALTRNPDMLEVSVTMGPRSLLLGPSSGQVNALLALVGARLRLEAALLGHDSEADAARRRVTLWLAHGSGFDGVVLPFLRRQTTAELDPDLRQYARQLIADFHSQRR